MGNPDEIIGQLISFRERDKFSSEAWKKRGLPSADTVLCKYLSSHFHDSANHLIAAIRLGMPASGLKDIIRKRLSSFKKMRYDTEEKAFICELFDEMATIVGIDFRHQLNNWLYGYIVMTAKRLLRILQPAGMVEMAKQACTGCGTVLQTHVTEKTEGREEADWLIAKCHHCGEFNLVSPGAGVSIYKCVNYSVVDHLVKQKYSHAEAMLRMEQIRVFRK